ncbi:FAD-dependent oxidoreductase [Paenibacillus sp. HB172176]|uniref:NAD(P)/FAD-dependent oxidoreductase n=1 Tax=Paenibacillus sp. HB172176 TaxID=2493690 RepID=UPI001439C2AA|nr:FAD-dependent oxidoreductase [Paenibacillus sp. HB172176]
MKELHTGQMYWPTTLAGAKTYAPLDSDAEAEVVIIGGGMSGVICSYMLSRGGLDTLLVEQDRIAAGSTSANTGLLQFCNDIMLSELTEQIGKEAAELFYRSCKAAVDQIAAAAHSLPVDTGFKQRSSLYYASSEQDLPKLRREFDALTACGFETEYWTPQEIEAHFPFTKPGAIITHGDAEVNPYQFVHALADAAAEAGARLHEKTSIEEHRTLSNGLHILRTSNGGTITARHVIFAVGYEPEELRGQLIKAELNRSFVIVTDPQPLKDWHHRLLIWETARPYLYLRTTIDGRIVAGGLDEDKSKLVHNDKQAAKHSEKLLELLQSHFPGLSPSIDYEWNAVFGESKDNLPFIGEDPKIDNVYYSLGYGGNGTVYSMMAARLLLAWIRQKSDASSLMSREDQLLSNVVSLNRRSLNNISTP